MGVDPPLAGVDRIARCIAPRMTLSRSFPLGGLCAAVALAAATSCGTEPAPARRTATAGHEHAAPRRAERQLGTVELQTTCSEGVQRDVEQALGLLHHMMYEQAREGFEQVLARDPECAMGHWGVAMTFFHPLWGDTPTREQLERGAAALRRARELTRDPRELAYIEAAAAYYEGWPSRDEPARLASFERGARALHERLPGDADAACFHALSLLATAPPEDRTYAQQRRAIAILDEVHARMPQHPGAIHYGIHAHDYPPLAADGVHLADAYDRIAPEVPHALHMPSHIYVRLGQWRKAAEWNRRSADAARRQPVDGARSMHYAHALDYLMYAYLQQMDDRRAAAVVEELEEERRYQAHGAAAYGIAAVHARWPLERREWDRAAQLSTDAIGADLHWDHQHHAAAVIAFARGLGAARSGDLASADRALAELERIERALAREARGAGELRYWHGRSEVQRDAVAAWIAHARGDQRAAVRLMTRAAEREEALGKHPTMPGFVLPARELLGDLLLEQGRPDAALAAYEASLRESPRRANGLYGAARAAERLGDREAQLDYSVRLASMASGEAVDRPILRETLAYLEAQRPTRVAAR